ncbi:MAG: glutamate--tRNA ligase [bacterium]|nr:glutamate--tRNA ligase [bacterium]
MSVRVRIAPSPTGYLHVGTARAALYNWLFARGRKGVFILRSDDTDTERNDPKYHEDIVTSMRWLGLDWDEGIEVGGPHAPYRQSLRFDRYREVAMSLLAEGKAYYSFATPEQLDGFRKEAQAAGRTPAYDGRFRVDAAEAAERVAAGEKVPIRMAVPRPGLTTFVDSVRDDVTFDHDQVDDFVILRSDGSPTYHLASTVDDVDFGITHVMRGEDILSSTPKHILLTQAMGATPPVYAHLALLMGPDGKKLSKRHGHTALNAYREAGILPEAMVNYLALLGWSPGEDETVVSLDEMIDRFDIDDVTKNPTIFDNDKLEWMNGVYIREMSTDDFVARISPMVEAHLGRPLETDEMGQLAAIAPHVQERAKRLTDVAEQVAFIFGDVVYDDVSWDKVMTTSEAPVAIAAATAGLATLQEWTTDSIEAALRNMLSETELSARKGFQPLRVALTGSTVSPPLFESIEVLGRERAIARLEAAQGRLA